MSVIVSFAMTAGIGSIHVPGIGAVRLAEIVDLGGVTEGAAQSGEVAVIANGESDPIVIAFGRAPDTDVAAGNEATSAAVGIPAGAVALIPVKAGDRIAVASLPAVPGAIADLAATAIDHESVGLAFTPASDATFHQYSVSLYEADEWSEPVTLIDDTVTGLAPETQYDFRVRGVNGFRFGPWSNVDDATTTSES